MRTISGELPLSSVLKLVIVSCVHIHIDSYFAFISDKYITETLCSYSFKFQHVFVSRGLWLEILI